MCPTSRTWSSAAAALLRNEGTGGGCFDGTFATNLADGSLKWLNTCLGATQTLAIIGDYLYKGSHIHDCASPTRTATRTTSRPFREPNRHVNSERLDNGFLGPWYPT